MKFITYLFVFGTCFLMFQNGRTQTQPEKVYSIVKVFKDYEWYVSQYEAWEKVIKKDRKNPAAWENYYCAARMAKITAPSEELLFKWASKMDDVIEKVEKNIPKTYEYYHLKCWHSSIWGSTKDKVDEIISWSQKAYEINPNRTEIYPDLMNAYMIVGDKKGMAKIGQKWLKSGDLSPSLIATTYNMLMSVEQDAILLTAGDNDTYPALILQHAQNIRPDITIINIFCAYGSNNYRKIQFQEKQLIPPTNVRSEREIIDTIIEQINHKPLYFSYGDYINNMESLQQKTYTVGLAFKYHDGPYNNISRIVKNFEQHFLLDQLIFNSYPEKFPEQVKRNNLTYLPALMQLYEHYKTVEDSKKMQRTATIIESIVENTSHEATISNFLNAK